MKKLFVGYGIKLKEPDLERFLFGDNGIALYFATDDIELLHSPYFLGIHNPISSIKNCEKQWRKFQNNCNKFGIKIPDGKLCFILTEKIENAKSN